MTNKSSYRIVFMGTPSFAVPTLQMLCENGWTPQAVYTQPDKANRRGNQISFSPVKTYALAQHIPVFQPQSLKGEEEAERLKALAPDVIIVVAYGRILPPSVLSIPKYGCINIHASLLPKYRGAAPVQRAIINGETETGITIMKIAEGLDTGDMISQQRITLPDTITAGELFIRLSQIGAEYLCRVLRQLPESLSSAQKQEEKDATYAEKLTKDMSRINWQGNAQQIDSLIRGMYPDPGTYTLFRGKRLKIHKAICGSDDVQDGIPAGTVLSTANGMIQVKTGRGTINLVSVQPENKKQMKASDFINGYQVKLYDKFES